MASGDPEPDKGGFGLEEDYKDPEQVGGEAVGVRILFKYVIQSFLLLGADMWVLTLVWDVYWGGSSTS